MTEYDPKNELVKKQYEEALLHGKYRDPKTVKAIWNSINVFEEFTGHANFIDVSTDKVKAFKVSQERKTNKSGELLSISTIRSTLNNIKEFFEWLSVHPQYVRKVDGRIVQFFRLSDNANRAARASREKAPPTLEELELALISMPKGTDIEKRDRALFAFTVITGIRDDALISLKRKDIDVRKKTVWQDPRHVRTKRRKGIVTRFIAQMMPLAEKIAIEWLVYQGERLSVSQNDPVFPKTLVKCNKETMVFEAQGLSTEHWMNTGPIREIFKRAFNAADLPYYNPHLFRKTICKWGLKNLTQYEYKALSQNLGHDYAMTTYNSYAKLSEDEQIEAMANIGSRSAELDGVSTNELLKEMARRAR